MKFHIPGSTLSDTRSDEILICLGRNMYCGINHVEGGSVTVCFLEQRTKGTLPPHARIRELADSNPGFARIVTPEALSAADHAPVHGAGNIYFGPRNVVENGMLMVGDAARVIAPLAGDGISMALQGAQLLGRIFAEQRRTSAGLDAIEQEYRREWEKFFKARVRAALLFQRLLLSTPLRWIGSSLFAVAPSLLRTALRITRGGHVSKATI